MNKFLCYSAIIAAALAPFAANAGPTSGYLLKQDTVPPSKTTSYTIQFNGDEDAVVDLDTKRDNHLDLQVYDAKGKLVAQSEAMEDPRCTWKPKKTASFTIIVGSTSTHELGYTLEAW